MSGSSDSEESLLRRILWRWATSFTSDKELQRRLVKETLDVAIKSVSVQSDDTPVDFTLLRTMRQIALREFGINSLIRTDEREPSQRLD